MSFRRYFTFPTTLSPVLRSNFTYWFMDIGWWGLYTGATAAFLTIYAARIGATANQIGLLSAVPALLALLISLPVGRWLETRQAQRITVIGCFIARLLFVVYALLPWLLPAKLQIGAILGLAIFSAIPNAVIGISFTRLFMVTVPSEWRGVIVGTRNAILAIVSFVITMVSGQILAHLAFPMGYQVVFFIGFIGGIMTVPQIARVRAVASEVLVNRDRLPDRSPADGASTPAPKRRLWPKVDAEGRRYLRVIGLLFLFNMTNNCVAPLIPNLLVNKLDLSDTLISIGTATNSMLVFIVSLSIAWLTRRTGNRRATALGAALLAFQALFLALARDATFYLVSAVTAGIATGVLNAAQYNYHLENIPAAERSSWLSWNMLLGNAAVLLGSLAGPLLARLGGSYEALLVFGALRFVMGLVILKWG
jgi:MFS family permease